MEPQYYNNKNINSCECIKYKALMIFYVIKSNETQHCRYIGNS